MLLRDFMKKIILMLLLVIPFLTACTSIDANLSINDNKSASLGIKISTDDDTDSSQIEFIKANYKNFLNDSYKITDSSTDRNINIIAKKTVKNLSKEDLDLSSLGFVSKLPSGRFIDVNHNFFITSFNINMVYNVKGQGKKLKSDANVVPEQAALEPEYLKKYSDEAQANDSLADADFAANIDPNIITHNPDYNSDSDSVQKQDDENTQSFDTTGLNGKFSISLPSLASYNNAQSNNGNVYSWIISNDSPTEIKLQYVVYSGFAFFFLILTGILLLIYLARRIHRHDTLKRIGNNN